MRTLLLCAVLTGMRRGELLGLRWEDVDLGSRGPSYLYPPSALAAEVRHTEVAAFAGLLILQSKGALHVAVPCVDDEGVDLVVGHRTTGRTLLLQIKSRFKLTGRSQYRADVRRATCPSDPNKLLLFVYYDEQRAGLGDTCWLINSQEFCALLDGQRKSREVYVSARIG